MGLIERLFKYTQKSDSCWLWTGSQDGKGYGQINVGGVPRKAYKVLWELDRGREVEQGLELDHRCRVRLCVRPSHLREVTHRENMENGANALKTHCPRGHEYNLENTWYNKKKVQRLCRVCNRDRQRKTKA